MAEDAWPIPWQEVAGNRGGALAALEYALFRGAVGLGSRLPGPARALLVGTLARLVKRIDRRRTCAARSFIEQALGPEVDARERERLVLCAWKHLFEVTLDDAAFNRVVLAGDLRAHYEVVLSDEVQRVIDSRSGGLCVVPHVGMWEALPPMAVALGIRPAYVVSRPPRNRYLARFAQRMREARGYRLIHRHGAIDSLIRAVQGGGFVGLMLDQRAHGKTILAPFFGRPARCERSIPILVRRLARPVIFGACYAAGGRGRYRLVFDAVIWPEELSRSSPEQIAARINREMERQILVAPEQYFWLHERWRGAPGAAAEGE